MHNPKTRVLLLMAIGLILIATMAHAGSQAGGAASIPTAPITYNITWQINTECPQCTHPWAVTQPSWQWAAGRTFTLVIRNLNGTSPYGQNQFMVNSTANATGFVSFQIQASPQTANTNATWDAALLVVWHNNYFLLYEASLKGTLADLIGNLTGHYYTILPNGTVLNYYYFYHGNASGTPFPTRGNVQASVVNSTWGTITQLNGAANYANFTSSVLHQFFLGVGTAGQSYNLTLTETLTINGMTVYTWLYKPSSSLSTSSITVFGPITYLGTYVPSLGTYSQTVSSMLSPSSVQYSFTVTLWLYNPQTGGYVSQPLIQSTNGINATANYVIQTLNYTTGIYSSTAPAVNASCQQLVIWPLPLSTLTITGVYDIKGNPVLSPEYLTFKVQENIGGYPLTISQQQGGWKTDITDLRFGFLHTLCGGTISSFSDLVNCFNTLTHSKLVNAVFSIYKPVTLAWISGVLQLTGTSATISSVNLSPRLVVEYSYQAVQWTTQQPQPTSGYIDAVVMQAPLNATSPVSARANITVSLLPVQIPLWFRNNVTLPNGQPFNNPALAQGLTFVLQGTTAQLSETGQYAVVADIWASGATGTNQLNTLYLWALPPYEYVPITPGVYADLLTVFNASGYLPLPTLNAIFTGSGFKYLTLTQAVGLSSLFQQYGLSVGTSQYSYAFRIYANNILVGTANVIANYPDVYANGTMVETQSNVANALQAQYGPEVYDDAYTVQAIYYNASAGVYGLQAQKLAFYNLEHAINIAINLKTLNILLRDFCNNVPSVVNGTISLTVIYGGQNVTLPSLPVSAEVPVTLPVAVDIWGAPQATTATAYVTLNYFGYKLYGATSNSAIPTAPQPIQIYLSNAPYFKPIVYLPISPATFQVMAAVWTENDSPSQVQEVYLGPQYPLAGFTVVPISTVTGWRMGESISNASGYAFFDELPLGVPIRMVVRTIIPSVDMVWPYTAAQTMYGNSYADYATWLGFSPNTYVYTLGTRGPIDAGLVVNNTVITLTKWCAGPQTFEAQVYNPVIRVFDKTGQHLLTSQYVVPGPYPGAAHPILANVTLVIADEHGPYIHASYWKNVTQFDYYVLTDFRLVGMTGMQSLFKNVAAQYLSLAQQYAHCVPSTVSGNVSDVANALAYAAMASWLANSSTDLYSAVFTLYSAQPKTNAISVCNMTPATVGTYDIAHLFLPGMRLHVRVWYMGYLVYDGYVTLNKPTVDINADVIPVNVTAFTKDLRLPVNSYVGFTLADAYFGVAFNSTFGYYSGAPGYNGSILNATYGKTKAIDVVKSLLAPYGFEYLPLNYTLVSTTSYGTSTMYDDKVQYNGTSRYAYYGLYEPVQSGMDFAYLPNLFLSRNLTSTLYLYTVNGTGYEHAASFDRWVEVLYPYALVRTYNVFERNAFIGLLSNGNTTAVPPFQQTPSGTYMTTFYIYMYKATNATNLLNYRTVVLYLPWGSGTSAIVNVTATDTATGASYTASYNLSKYSNLSQNLLEYPINIRNIALNVAPGYSRDLIEFTVSVAYTSGPTAMYYSTPWANLTTEVQLTAKYMNVTIGVANGASATEYFVVNITNFGNYSKYGGFGAPITYVVPSGSLAFLPAYPSGSSAAGSYIARVWIIAAGSKEALCTTGPAVLGPLTDAKGANVVGYDFFGSKYLVVNYLPVSNATTQPTVPIWTSTNLDEFYDGSGQIAGLGFPIGATSSFAIAYSTGLPVWNVTALYALGQTSIKLPTTALDWLHIYNNASFPILVSSVTVSCLSGSYTIPLSGEGYVKTYTTQTQLVAATCGLQTITVSSATGQTITVPKSCYVYVPPYADAMVALADYGFGLSYAINASGIWALDVYRQPYNYSVTAYYGGVYNLTQHFLNDIPIQAARSLSSVTKQELGQAYQLAKNATQQLGLLIKIFNLQPLSSASYQENVLYASHGSENISGWWYIFNVTRYNGDKQLVNESTAMTWYSLVTNSSDYYFNYYFYYPELPLKFVLDWNARPLANQTVVLYDRRTHEVFAVIYTTNNGELAYDLPDISFNGYTPDVYVSWFDGYLLYKLTGNPAYVTWIYQQDVANDVYQLGNATTSAQIRTYVYPATITVNGPNGQPLANVYVRVYDDATKGAMFYFYGMTSSAGSATIYDALVSSYPAGFLSQLPSTNFDYDVLYPYSSSTAAAPASSQIWVPVATGTFSIQRGATVPSSGYSIVSQVTMATQIPLSQPIGVSGYFVMETPSGNVTIPFKTATISGTNYLVASQPIPTSVSYPLEMVITSVSINGVPITLAKPFTAMLTTTSLPSSLDLASLGLVAPVTVQAVDGFGKVRSDWPIAIAINGQTVATGSGTVTAYLPLSEYAGTYNVTVETTVKTPSGATVVNTTTLSVAGPTTYTVAVPSGAISASVVDAFGTALTSSPIQIANVAAGTGSVTAEVLAGTYTVSAQAYGYTWSKTVAVSRGQIASVQIVVPTAKISASVVDQAKGTTGAWPIEIVGPSGIVASGTGTVEATVLAQTPDGTPIQYNVVATTPFGAYSTGSFAPAAGQVTTKTITVPTAILQISAVDDNGYPINSLVSQVDIYYANGTLFKSFSTAPVEVEVLGGQQYTIKVTAQQGHVGTASITPAAGQTVALRVTVPGTAGIQIGGVRVPIPELVLWIVLIIVIVIIVAILLMEYSNWRRRRLMQILAPPK
ncbi:DUF4397 domain-containing protein [Thermoproteus tenax]|uniref:Uncharacterized protein n=1 Tax=Thermoproteus tenax (strain ATCC 35583 / DSM 2078 / JCM 9277 / NBRC 100435 / Kra 1) TaxID=768679 RepID=G4RLQ9_THETK|nr:DUF4397 domain-containing protein [Thermoproteus tenax]CCC82504.1 conserved hypothetical protein [Thermoproteus tenax Kra 1]